MRSLDAAQDRIAGWLGLAPPERAPIVGAMLRPPSGDAVGYWLQLVIATALATLGLALDSTAVVIGAMLIAPLMRPIIELAMGLATGSPPLAFRAGSRALKSIAIVVASATLIVWLLPFREATPELLARTAPSLLDLFVAAACAVAGAYAAMRATSDIASTAAGTSIGISLVPPLCTAGYGLAAGDWPMARGAALLFTANIAGILAVASVLFVIVGFGRVDVAEQEQALVAEGAIGHGVGERLGRGLARRATKRMRPITRIAVPVLLLGAIFVPLRGAVSEMSRRSRIRQDLGALLDAPASRVVQRTLDMTANGVTLRVVIVGDEAAARALDERLRALLAAQGEPRARVNVWAIPEATALTALAARLDELPPPIVPEPPPQVARRESAAITAAVQAAWPTEGTGALLATWVELGAPTRVRVVHLGPPLGAAGQQLLARAAHRADEPLEVEEDALQPIAAAAEDGVAWLGAALALAERSRRVPAVRLCVELPAPPAPPAPVRGRALPPADPFAIAPLRAAAERALADRPEVTIATGDAWRITPTTGPCAALPRTPP